VSQRQSKKAQENILLLHGSLENTLKLKAEF